MQLGGALVVGSLAMVAVLIAPTSVELPAARLTVAATIAALVYFESRTSTSRGRAAAYGLLALLAGVTVALLKSWLVH